MTRIITSVIVTTAARCKHGLRRQGLVMKGYCVDVVVVVVVVVWVVLFASLLDVVYSHQSE